MTGDRSKSARHQLAAFSYWAKIDPAERARIMSERGKASAAARAAERAAAGIPPARRRRNAEPLPSAEELAPFLEALDSESHETPLTYESRFREAVLRLRLDIAQQTVEALRRAKP
jgi:hypothetical protein